MTDASYAYPTTTRYYVRVDPQTTIVQTFYIIPPGQSVTAPDFHEITQEDYDRFTQEPGAKWVDGALATYTPPPPPPPPLKDQAQAAMQSMQQQASMVTAMGETFGPQMRDYVRALRAIIEGADTTSTTLPTMPDEATQ